MVFLALGSVPFLVFFLFDVVSLREIPFLKPLIVGVSVPLFGLSATMLCLTTERLPLPAPVSLVAWLPAVMFLLLGLFSFFVEIPLRTTYLRKGHGEKLVTTGTYALVRHPAVVWFILFMVSLFLVTGSKGLLIAIPVWGLLDVVHVVVQEKVYLVPVFGQPYRQYQRNVPMLIPNRESFLRCRQTLFAGDPEKQPVLHGCAAARRRRSNQSI